MRKLTFTGLAILGLFLVIGVILAAPHAVQAAVLWQGTDAASQEAIEIAATSQPTPTVRPAEISPTPEPTQAAPPDPTFTAEPPQAPPVDPSPTSEPSLAAPTATSPAIEPSPQSLPTETPTAADLPQQGLPGETATQTATEPAATLPSEADTLAPSHRLLFPLASRQKFSGDNETVFMCTALNQPLAVPDNYGPGLDYPLSSTDERFVWDLNVQVQIDHTWVSDLIVRLTHLDTGKTAVLVDRIGIPGSDQGCNRDHIGSIFDDETTLPAESRCAGGYSPAAVAGIYRPAEALRTFDGDRLSGAWVLNVSDNFKNDTGSLRNWCLVASLNEGIPAPEVPPAPLPLPAQAQVFGVTGQKQALPLDCESRVAVDWAKFFGFSINEIQFFNRLPVSTNPDLGFVGDVYGLWGQTPPNPYGVHAEPVAQLLRDYGVQAYAHRPLGWDGLRAEIAAGRPVYVWVVGSGNLWNQTPRYYRDQSGARIIVAPYQHVVIVTGYTETEVTIMDGGTRFVLPTAVFLSSWSAMHEMAITATP